MSEMVGILGFFLMVLVLPLVIILHYITKWKQTKGLTDEEQQLLEDLWEGSEKMLERLDALETILDEKSAKWRDQD